jgi:hypothetical protein
VKFRPKKKSFRQPKALSVRVTETERPKFRFRFSFVPSLVKMESSKLSCVNIMFSGVNKNVKNADPEEACLAAQA